jgi:hypothetical protein
MIKKLQLRYNVQGYQILFADFPGRQDQLHIPEKKRIFLSQKLISEPGSNLIQEVFLKVGHIHALANQISAKDLMTQMFYYFMHL